MFRASFNQGSFIQVSYGIEDSKGVFLSVSDSRLQFDEASTKEANDIRGQFSSNGVYLDLHTGSGTGTKVSLEVITTFLKKYDVPQEQMKALDNAWEFQKQSKKSETTGNVNGKKSKKCDVCQTLTTLRCSRCKALAICSQKCMKENWPNHKKDCNNILDSKVAATREMNRIGYTPSETGGGSVPIGLDLNILKDATVENMKIYEKYGLQDPPLKDTPISSINKIELLLEVLVLYDTSSIKNKYLPLPQKMFYNRRYNNTINHAKDNLYPHEHQMFINEMRLRRIGETNK